MWTDQKLKEFTRECIDKYSASSPSSIVLKSYYMGNSTTKDERFQQQRSMVEQEISIYKQGLR